MKPPRSEGLSETVSIAIAAAFVVAISIAVLTYVTSTSNITRQQEAEKLNKDELVLRSMLGADYVYFPSLRGVSGQGVAKLRNTGDVTVTVLKLIVYRNGTPVHDTNPSYDPARYVTLGRMEASEVYFMCPGCNPGDPVLVTVHYVPTALIDPRDPSRVEPLIRTMLFRVASFKAEVPNADIGKLCPSPVGGWLLVDYVDPVEVPIYVGRTLTRFQVEGGVKLRIGMASDQELEPTEIRVTLQDKYGNTAIGSATVSGTTPKDLTVPLTAPSPLRYPLTVTITSDRYTVLPGVWRFNVDSDVVYPDFAKLNVDRLNLLTTSMLVSVYAIDNADVSVSVQVIDCNGGVSGRSSGTLITLIPGGADYLNLQGTADLSPPAQLLRLYDVTIDYTEVTPIHTVTMTVTVTETTTATVTSTTTTTTVPSTVTTTKTSTTTATVYRTTGTSSTTTIRSATSVIWTTTTSTSTRTIYTYTTVYTATVSLSRTVITTVYTSTTTLSRTSTISSTSTVYSPTITQTLTSYSTVYTTTRTFTQTSTVGTTITRTTTVTVTITVSPGGGYLSPVTTSELRTPLDPSLLLFVSGGLGLAGMSSPFIYRTLRREGVVRR
ncbi:MAG: hypothetical protein QXP81_02205 [Nitrososphaerota archaeon]